MSAVELPGNLDFASQTALQNGYAVAVHVRPGEQGAHLTVASLRPYGDPNGFYRCTSCRRDCPSAAFVLIGEQVGG